MAPCFSVYSLVEAEIFSLLRAFPFVSLISLAFVATCFPSRLAFLLTFSPYLLPFYSACFLLSCVPQATSAPTRPPTANSWSLVHSPFPEVSCVPTMGTDGFIRSVPVLTKLMIQWGHCHMVPLSIQGHVVCKVLGRGKSPFISFLTTRLGNPVLNTEFKPRSAHPQLCIQMTSPFRASVSLSGKWV